jgi:hypothetical protein
VHINSRIETMRPWVERADWAGLQRASREACRVAAPDTEPRIAAVDTRPYMAALREMLANAAGYLHDGIEAAYWEFDVDSSWDSAVFLCRSYRPEAAGDDDWASDFDAKRIVSGPRMVELAGFLQEWNGSDSAAAVNAYLIARTVAAFGDAAAAWPIGRPLCAGYHDQSILFRIVSGPADPPDSVYVSVEFGDLPNEPGTSSTKLVEVQLDGYVRREVSLDRDGRPTYITRPGGYPTSDYPAPPGSPLFVEQFGNGRLITRDEFEAAYFAADSALD